jgi:hypothetical protein
MLRKLSFCSFDGLENTSYPDTTSMRGIRDELFYPFSIYNIPMVSGPQWLAITLPA